MPLFQSTVVVCDICLQQFPLIASVWLRSNKGEGVPQPVAPSVFKRFLGGTLGNAKGSSKDPTRKAIAEWYASGNYATCPNCGERVPEEVLTRRSLVIGLVGEPGSAKSHYVATLLQLLESGALARDYDITNVFSDATADRYESEYAPLFDRTHRILAPTYVVDSEEDHYLPLIITLRNPMTGKALNLRIFDASGEQMKNSQQQASYNKYLYACNALMLFVTPAMLADIRSLLDDNQILGHRASKTTAMFEALANGIQTIASRRPDAPINKVHVSVLLTKADQVLNVPGFDPCLLEPLEHGMFYLDELADRIKHDSAKIVEFLSATGGANIVNLLMTRFAALVFYAVSSTGCDPVQATDPEDSYYPQLTPMRILEPLLMLLKEVGFLTSDDWSMQ